MIQRKQTLLLFLLGFLNVVLLFIASQKAVVNGNAIPVTLTPIQAQGLASTTGHMAAIYLNFTLLVLTFITVFIYNKRELQIKLCYGIGVLWLVLTAMMAFCPFVAAEVAADISKNFLVCLIGIIAFVLSLVAARMIKKDIELLKSADRIR
jgi:hypothetical protein